jgi:probable phosphoglycerate mutase
MLRLLLTRHGESEWQIRGDRAGHDSKLTNLGLRQAELLGVWLAKNIRVDYIYASPLKRAHETAEVVARHLNLPVTLHEGLTEAWFFVSPELPSYTTPLDILDGDSARRKGAANDYRAFRVRVASVLRTILSQHQDGTILIVAHGGTVETVLRLLLGSDAFTANIGNTTLHSLVWFDNRWHIEYVDRWEHLPPSTA